MSSIKLFSSLFFVFFAVFLYKKHKSSVKRFLIVTCAFVLLLSAVYHTMFLGNIDVFKVSWDAMAYASSIFSHTVKIEEFLDFRRGNKMVYIIGIIAQNIFGKYCSCFSDFFFLLSMINSFISLCALHVFFVAHNFFRTTSKMLCINSFIFLQPFTLLRGGIPGADSSILFSLCVFLYAVVSEKPMYVKILWLFVLSLCHKMFPIPCALTLAYFSLKLHKKTLRALSVLGCFLLIYYALDLDHLMSILTSHKQDSTHRLSCNSYIPTCWLPLRCLNFFLAPLLTNCTHFLERAPNGNILGFTYAVYVNLIIVFMSIRVFIFLLKGGFFSLQGSRECFIVIIIFIVSLSIEGVYCINYLQTNRHSTSVLSLWIFLMLLISGNAYPGDNSKVDASVR